MTRYRDRYEEIFELLSRAELQKGSSGLDEISAGPELFGYENDRWLGFYTHEGLEIALRKYGFFRDLERLGFHELRTEARTDDPDRHLFRLWSTRPRVDDPLIELSVRRDFLRPHSELADRVSQTHLPVLTVDWLLMQNPTASFSEVRPPLPGQDFPGLGVGAQVLELLRNVCRRLDLAGIATVPSYFHNALFYSREFRHFDPRFQGQFRALQRDVLPAVDDSITAASWALYWEFVRRKDAPDTPFPWFQQLMVDPVSESFRHYFDDQAYRRERDNTADSHRFQVLTDPLDQKLRRRGICPFDADKIDDWLR